MKNLYSTEILDNEQVNALNDLKNIFRELADDSANGVWYDSVNKPYFRYVVDNFNNISLGAQQTFEQSDKSDEAKENICKNVLSQLKGLSNNEKAQYFYNLHCADFGMPELSNPSLKQPSDSDIEYMNSGDKPAQTLRTEETIENNKKYTTYFDENDTPVLKVDEKGVAIPDDRIRNEKGNLPTDSDYKNIFKELKLRMLNGDYGEEQRKFAEAKGYDSPFYAPKEGAKKEDKGGLESIDDMLTRIKNENENKNKSNKSLTNAELFKYQSSQVKDVKDSTHYEMTEKGQTVEIDTNYVGDNKPTSPNDISNDMIRNFKLPEGQFDKENAEKREKQKDFTEDFLKFFNDHQDTTNDDRVAKNKKFKLDINNLEPLHEGPTSVQFKYKTNGDIYTKQDLTKFINYIKGLGLDDRYNLKVTEGKDKNLILTLKKNEECLEKISYNELLKITAKNRKEALEKDPNGNFDTALCMDDDGNYISQNLFPAGGGPNVLITGASRMGKGVFSRSLFTTSMVNNPNVKFVMFELSKNGEGYEPFLNSPALLRKPIFYNNNEVGYEQYKEVVDAFDELIAIATNQQNSPEKQEIRIVFDEMSSFLQNFYERAKDDKRIDKLFETFKTQVKHISQVTNSQGLAMWAICQGTADESNGKASGIFGKFQAVMSLGLNESLLRATDRDRKVFQMACNDKKPFQVSADFKGNFFEGTVPLLTNEEIVKAMDALRYAQKNHIPLTVEGGLPSTNPDIDYTNTFASLRELESEGDSYSRLIQGLETPDNEKEKNKDRFKRALEKEKANGIDNSKIDLQAQDNENKQDNSGSAQTNQPNTQNGGSNNNSQVQTPNSNKPKIINDHEDGSDILCPDCLKSVDTTDKDNCRYLKNKDGSYVAFHKDCLEKLKQNDPSLEVVEDANDDFNKSNGNQSAPATQTQQNPAQPSQTTNNGSNQQSAPTQNQKTNTPNQTNNQQGNGNGNGQNNSQSAPSNQPQNNQNGGSSAQPNTQTPSQNNGNNNGGVICPHCQKQVDTTDKDDCRYMKDTNGNYVAFHKDCIEDLKTNNPSLEVFDINHNPVKDNGNQTQNNSQNNQQNNGNQPAQNGGNTQQAKPKAQYTPQPKKSVRNQQNQQPVQQAQPSQPVNQAQPNQSAQPTQQVQAPQYTRKYNSLEDLMDGADARLLKTPKHDVETTQKLIDGAEKRISTLEAKLNDPNVSEHRKDRIRDKIKEEQENIEGSSGVFSLLNKGFNNQLEKAKKEYNKTRSKLVAKNYNDIKKKLIDAITCEKINPNDLSGLTQQEQDDYKDLGFDLREPVRDEQALDDLYELLYNDDITDKEKKVIRKLIDEEKKQYDKTYKAWTDKFKQKQLDWKTQHGTDKEKLEARFKKLFNVFKNPDKNISIKRKNKNAPSPSQKVAQAVQNQVNQQLNGAQSAQPAQSQQTPKNWNNLTDDQKNRLFELSNKPNLTQDEQDEKNRLEKLLNKSDKFVYSDDLKNYLKPMWKGLTGNVISDTRMMNNMQTYLDNGKFDPKYKDDIQDLIDSYFDGKLNNDDVPEDMRNSLAWNKNHPKNVRYCEDCQKPLKAVDYHYHTDDKSKEHIICKDCADKLKMQGEDIHDDPQTDKVKNITDANLTKEMSVSDIQDDKINRWYKNMSEDDFNKLSNDEMQEYKKLYDAYKQREKRNFENNLKGISCDNCGRPLEKGHIHYKNGEAFCENCFNDLTTSQLGQPKQFDASDFDDVNINDFDKNRLKKVDEKNKDTNLQLNTYKDYLTGNNDEDDKRIAQLEQDINDGKVKNSDKDEAQSLIDAYKRGNTPKSAISTSQSKSTPSAQNNNQQGQAQQSQQSQQNNAPVYTPAPQQSAGQKIANAVQQKVAQNNQPSGSNGNQTQPQSQNGQNNNAPSNTQNNSNQSKKTVVRIRKSKNGGIICPDCNKQVDTTDKANCRYLKNDDGSYTAFHKDCADNYRKQNPNANIVEDAVKDAKQSLTKQNAGQKVANAIQQKVAQNNQQPADNSNNPADNSQQTNPQDNQQVQPTDNQQNKVDDSTDTVLNPEDFDGEFTTNQIKEIEDTLNAVGWTDQPLPEKKEDVINDLKEAQEELQEAIDSGKIKDEDVNKAKLVFKNVEKIIDNYDAYKKYTNHRIEKQENKEDDNLNTDPALKPKQQTKAEKQNAYTKLLANQDRLNRLLNDDSISEDEKSKYRGDLYEVKKGLIPPRWILEDQRDSCIKFLNMKSVNVNKKELQKELDNINKALDNYDDFYNSELDKLNKEFGKENQSNDENKPQDNSNKEQPVKEESIPTKEELEQKVKDLENQLQDNNLSDEDKHKLEVSIDKAKDYLDNYDDFVNDSKEALKEGNKDMPKDNQNPQEQTQDSNLPEISPNLKESYDEMLKEAADKVSLKDNGLKDLDDVINIIGKGRGTKGFKMPDDYIKISDGLEKFKEEFSGSGAESKGVLKFMKEFFPDSKIVKDQAKKDSKDTGKPETEEQDYRDQFSDNPPPIKNDETENTNEKNNGNKENQGKDGKENKNAFFTQMTDKMSSIHNRASLEEVAKQNPQIGNAVQKIDTLVNNYKQKFNANQLKAMSEDEFKEKKNDKDEKTKMRIEYTKMINDFEAKFGYKYYQKTESK